MKKFVTIFITLLSLVLLIGVLASCNGVIGGVKTLYVYNWGEYIADGSEGSADVNDLFEQYYYEKTGEHIKVNYSTFSSNEDLYAKISSGAVSYDVIVPSDYMIERLIKEDLLEEINPAETMDNYGCIIDEFKNLPYDPDNIYSVPYFYGMVGVIYNSEMVDENCENIGSWNLMWDEDYKGEILQFNNSRDAFGSALYRLGYYQYVNSDDEKYWNEALESLLDQKKIVQGYVMDEIYNKMESGSAAISSYYAGDYLSMYENNDSLEFFYPSEGTNYYVDAMCVPKGSANKDIAIEYINFMLNGDIEIDGEEYNIAVENAEMTYYASPNTNVFLNEDYFKYMEDRYTDEEREEGDCGIRNGAIAILYPDNINEILDEMGMTYEEYLGDELGEDVLELWSKKPISMYRNLSDESLSRLNILWEKLKIESSIGTGIYIICGVIVLAIIVIVVSFTARRKKRAKYYTYTGDKAQ